jgi:hypothetical protein
MPQKVSFKVVLDALLNDTTPFPAAYLREFSDITPSNLRAFMKVWPQVSFQRKHTLLEDLEDVAETDTLTSFDDMARPLLTDEDPFVRIQAIHLQWESEDKSLIPIYLEMLEKDKDAGVRAAAANALGMFVYLGELEKVPEDMFHTIEDRLLKVVHGSEDVLVRRRALESLGYSSREEIAPLIEAAYRDKDPDWVVSALFAMGRSNDERWKKQILAQLRESNEDIRMEAIVAAGELELSSARPVLLDSLDDEEDLEVRRALVWALSKIGGEGVRTKLDELVEMEGDDDEAAFLEEALENLSFTEDAQFDLFGINGMDEFLEEDADDHDDD